MAQFDLLGQAFKRDPLPTFTAMRAQGHVVRDRVVLLGSVSFTTTFEAAEALLKRRDDFVVDGQNAGLQRGFGIKWWMPRGLRVLANNMLSTDDPGHKRMRGLVDQAFSRRRVEDLHGQITQIADMLIDRLEVRGRGDLVSDFARPLPLAVICELLGLPRHDMARFSRWMVPISSASSALDIVRMLPAIHKISAYLREQFEQRKRNPRNDLISALVTAERDGEILSEDELLATCFLLFVAGHETTTHLISGAMLALFEHPESRSALAQNGALAHDAVSELHRFTTPVQMSKPRFAARDTTVAGVHVRRGEALIALLGAANSDPAAFHEPHRLDVGRSPNRHLGFGTGNHMCLGVQLARAETTIAVTRLLQRCPTLTLQAKRGAPSYTRRIGLRALKALYVEI